MHNLVCVLVKINEARHSNRIIKHHNNLVTLLISPANSNETPASDTKIYEHCSLIAFFVVR